MGEEFEDRGHGGLGGFGEGGSEGVGLGFERVVGAFWRLGASVLGTGEAHFLGLFSFWGVECRRLRVVTRLLGLVTWM